VVVGSTAVSAHVAMRTCIGCRTKAAAAELLRVVVARTSSGVVSSSTDMVLVVPDPDRSASGRGAWLHPDLACALLAQRRRAYARALRVPAATDPAPVLQWLAEVAAAGS
jgi:predicted RNA-binding protein YlxR (DUF448 family)